MSAALEKMRKRLEFHGGITQESRFIKDKERSLKKALLYSYQAETITLEDGRNFRALLNPDKLKPQYDNKIISIPFQDICLNKNRMEKIGMKPGDYFYWKNTNSWWIVYLNYLEENAYFRAEVRRCDYEITINDNLYRVAVQGPTQTKVDWEYFSHDYINRLNYTLFCMVVKNEETLDFFKRHQKCMLNGKPWKLEVADEYNGDGVIQFYLEEDYTQVYEDPAEVAVIEQPEGTAAAISGPQNVYPFDTVDYQIKNADLDGDWYITEGEQTQLAKQSSSTFKLYVGSKGNRLLTLEYKKGEEVIAKLDIKVNYL